MVGKPKRHHTVPRFYLRRFADGTRLSAVNVETGVRHSTNVLDATAESNFYTVPDHPTDPTYFESALSATEGAAAGLYRKITRGEWPLTQPDRVAFAEFMTLQFLRVQGQRKQMHKVIESRLRALGESDPEELRRILSLRGAPVGVDIAAEDLPALVSSAVHVRQIELLLPRLKNFLLERPWELIGFDAPSLLTSDEPLTPLPDPRQLQSVGLGLENSWALLFPLSREAAILMFRDSARARADETSAEVMRGLFDLSRPGDIASSHLFNTNTVMHAHRFVFHHPLDAHLLPRDLTALSKRGGRIDATQIPRGLFPGR